MLQVTNILFLYVETALHAGSGRGVGNVDLPIQRNQVHGYPIVQGSGLKGCLRADAKQHLSEVEWVAIFGPETKGAADHAGAISIGEANTLLFPVRSLKGVFAWTTSAHVLACFCRDCRLLGENAPQWSVPELETGTALVAEDSSLRVDDTRIAVEELSFKTEAVPLVATIADWLKQDALPPGPEYSYWRNHIDHHLVILADDDFRDFTRLSTEVVTRVRISGDTKTVEAGALWTEESLPADTLMYALVSAGKPLSADQAGMNSGQDVLVKLRGMPLERTRLGGDETVGRGNVFLRWWEG
jgi:CRISPR-associated protein Cmr4